MKKTVLHDLHILRGAKMTPFGGYDMPMQFDGIMREHEAARTAAAVFDTCHMGEFLIGGKTAADDLDKLVSRNIADMRVGTCRCGFLCNDGGGVIDDQILYRLADDEFMMVVNAANSGVDYEWVSSRLSADTVIKNVSDETAKIDVHGPKSPKILKDILRDDIGGLKYFNFMRNYYDRSPRTNLSSSANNAQPSPANNVPTNSGPAATSSSVNKTSHLTRGDCNVIVSRTGYTGEIGFEIYCPLDVAADIWNDCIDRGATPAGLGARDTLRLEMGYPLHGHELSATRNAAQSGLGYAITRGKNFIGSNAIFADDADSQLLCGIKLEGRRAARHGDVVKDVNGRTVGAITSGSFSPTLGYAIALAYIDKTSSSTDTPLSIMIGKSEVAGKICNTPFYKNGTARANINLYL